MYKIPDQAIETKELPHEQLITTTPIIQPEKKADQSIAKSTKEHKSENTEQHQKTTLTIECMIQDYINAIFRQNKAADLLPSIIFTLKTKLKTPFLLGINPNKKYIDNRQFIDDEEKWLAPAELQLIDRREQDFYRAVITHIDAIKGNSGHEILMSLLHFQNEMQRFFSDQNLGGLVTEDRFIATALNSRRFFQSHSVNLALKQYCEKKTAQCFAVLTTLHSFSQMSLYQALKKTTLELVKEEYKHIFYGAKQYTSMQLRIFNEDNGEELLLSGIKDMQEYLTSKGYPIPEMTQSFSETDQPAQNTTAKTGKPKAQKHIGFANIVLRYGFCPKTTAVLTKNKIAVDDSVKPKLCHQ